MYCFLLKGHVGLILTLHTSTVTRCCIAFLIELPCIPAVVRVFTMGWTNTLIGHNSFSADVYTVQQEKNKMLSVTYQNMQCI